MSEPTLYEKSVAGRRGVSLPALDVPEAPLPEDRLREQLALPELSQLDLVRHYQRLAERNFGVDSGFFLLQDAFDHPVRMAARRHHARFDLARLAVADGGGDDFLNSDQDDIQTSTVFHCINTSSMS